jgi:hypothetical protein
MEGLVTSKKNVMALDVNAIIEVFSCKQVYGGMNLFIMSRVGFEKILERTIWQAKDVLSMMPTVVTLEGCYGEVATVG